MRMRTRLKVRLSAGVGLLVALGLAHAQQVYRCSTPQGTVITDRPCDGETPRTPAPPRAEGPQPVVTQANRGIWIERKTEESYRAITARFPEMPEKERRARARDVAETLVDAAIQVQEHHRVHGPEIAEERRKADERLAVSRKSHCEQVRSEAAYLERISRDGLPRGEIRTREEIDGLPAALAKARRAVSEFCK